MASHFQQVPPVAPAQDSRRGGVPYIEPSRIERLFDQPRDYVQGIRFVPSHHRPTLLERFTLLMRLNGEAISYYFALVCIGLLLAAVVGAYFGWRVR